MSNDKAEQLIKVIDEAEKHLNEARKVLADLMTSLEMLGILKVSFDPEPEQVRQACCGYSRSGENIHAIVPSSKELAFFESKPDQEYDTYYCGCLGWD
jgi:hypothetical protein